ncbi:MAG TPA: FAD-dependent oxidoreductase [Planctomycetaceae bacterium]|nr:FAD-dependent oxidoreductase [Planctomycetaceae bacterium]
MTRRGFSALTGLTAISPLPLVARTLTEDSADVVIAGAGLGGCAATLACLQYGLSVTLIEPTDWLGGQISSQGVPPDEHQWIETHGANRSYRQFRTAIREYYRLNYRLTAQAYDDQYFNPGQGSVSRLCCEPKVAHTVLQQWFQPHLASGRLKILYETRVVSAETQGDRVQSITAEHTSTGQVSQLTGRYFVDATELGDLLPLTGTEFITGAESQAQTGELHAARQANPDNQQAFTMCFAIDYQPQADNTIERPAEYDFWREFVPQLTPPWPGRLLDLSYSNPRTLAPKQLGFDPTGKPTEGNLNLWNYRRIIDHSQFLPDHFESDISLINWPQNDFFLGNLVGVSAEKAQESIRRAKQLSLSLLYWLQTEVPRADGLGQGYPGLRLRADLMGTQDGLAKSPYIRESRRIVAQLTITEQHVGCENRRLLFHGAEAESGHRFDDSVGVGSYPIDLHPSSTGDNYIDFLTFPFELPLGALLPVRMENLLPACKNIGTTHLTSGCYRLHPVEWGIGEAVGHCIGMAVTKGISPKAIREQPQLLQSLQETMDSHGVERHWAS